MNIIGDPRGRNIIIVDDLIDTGGTFVNAVKTLKEAGAEDIYGACTHPLLSGDASERIKQSDVTRLFVTDTIAVDSKIDGNKKIEILSVAKLFAEAIKRGYKNQSISSLFDIDKG
jgi:ribose-phosphate pyrophosphokinase